MFKLSTPINVEKIILGTILAGGFVGIALAAMIFGVEAGAVATIVATVLATLGSLLGIIVASAWPKGSDTDKQTIKNLTEKVNPVTVPAADLTSEQLRNETGILPEGQSDGSVRS